MKFKPVTRALYTNSPVSPIVRRLCEYFRSIQQSAAECLAAAPAAAGVVRADHVAWMHRDHRSPTGVTNGDDRLVKQKH